MCPAEDVPRQKLGHCSLFIGGAEDTGVVRVQKSPGHVSAYQRLIHTRVALRQQSCHRAVRGRTPGHSCIGFGFIHVGLCTDNWRRAGTEIAKDPNSRSSHFPDLVEILWEWFVAMESLLAPDIMTLGLIRLRDKQKFAKSFRRHLLVPRPNQV